MSIIKIILATMIRIACGIIAVCGVLTEGLTKIFEKLSEYLNVLDDKVDGIGKKKSKKETIDVPV